MPDSSPRAPASRWLAPFLLTAYCTGAVAVWLPTALSLGRQCGWMALPVAVGAAVVLRGAGGRGGMASALLAAGTVAVIAAAANWLIAAAHVGAPLGLTPWLSALKLGPAYALTLLALASTRTDLVCLALGPPLAALATLGLSARRRAS